MALHKNVNGQDVHVINAYTYIDAADREAEVGFISSDVGKVAKQIDDSSYWVLAEYSPILWKNITGTSTNVIDAKNSVIALSDTNIASLSGLSEVIDDINIDTDGYRIALTGQTDETQNGLWISHASAWTRPLDFASASDADGAYFFVEAGTVYAYSGWICSTLPPAVIDTDNINFVQFTGGVTPPSNNYDFLLESDPPTPSNTYTNVKTGSKVTQEVWQRVSDSTNIKTIDYSYDGLNLSQEIRKIYAANGITVVAQLTLTYIFNGSSISSITATRDI